MNGSRKHSPKPPNKSESYKIFDNDGKTFDRFTLINSNGDVFSFSDNPFHPQGFGQFNGNVKDWKNFSTDTIGKEISIDELPEGCLVFVVDRQ